MPYYVVHVVWYDRCFSSVLFSGETFLTGFWQGLQISAIKMKLSSLSAISSPSTTSKSRRASRLSAPSLARPLFLWLWGIPLLPRTPGGWPASTKVSRGCSSTTRSRALKRAGRLRIRRHRNWSSSWSSRSRVRASRTRQSGARQRPLGSPSGVLRFRARPAQEQGRPRRRARPAREQDRPRRRARPA